MLRGGTFGYRSLRWGALSLTIVIALAAFCDGADARRGHRHKSQAAESYQPSYSSIVVDINSGEVMQASNADAPRHPASLTKIMTLYMLFERLEQGKIKLQTELPVSAHAAVQAPSKLGLKPGETIRVETAIRAIVTKSANDVAVIVAEALGGDEPSFAKLMSAKARALGMTQTTYRNASGLPDEEQITTARDQALLGRAIQDRFPKLLSLLCHPDLRLPGQIDPKPQPSARRRRWRRWHQDGLYPRFRVQHCHVNPPRQSPPRGSRVWRSLCRCSRRARTQPDREQHQHCLDQAHRSACRSRDGRPHRSARTARKPRMRTGTGSARVRVASVAPSVPEGPAPGSTDPIKPTAVKTVVVHPATMYTASLSPLPSDNRQLVPAPVSFESSECHQPSPPSEANHRSLPRLSPAAPPATSRGLCG